LQKTKNTRIHIMFLLILSMILSNFSLIFANGFSDIENHWAKNEIESWIKRGLIEGYSDGTFRPNNDITRAEFIKLTNRAFGYIKEDTISFSDVLPSDWFYSEIAKAKAARYISGYPDGTMKPNDPISRQEAASIIVRILGLEQNARAAEEFIDYDKIPAWSRSYVGAVLITNIMEGYPDGTFKAEDFIKRAEAIITLGRAIEYVSDLGAEPDSGVIIYDKPGTYGPSKGTEAFDRDVLINSDGVILQNILIKGNLTLDKKIAEGDVTLENVIAEEDTFIYGGGKNSIVINNSDLNRMTINKEDSRIRVVYSGSTTVKEINIKSETKLEVSGKSVIEILNVDAVTEVVGKGTIKKANVNVSGVSFEKKPDKLEKSGGVTVKIIKKEDVTSGGGGGDGYDSTTRVKTISIEQESQTLPIEARLQLSVRFNPANPTNRKVSWSSSDKDIATVNNTGLVETKKIGTATIRATSEDGGKTDTIEIMVAEGSIKIKSVSPNEDLVDGSEYTFNVNVEYEFEGIEKGVLYIGFNNGEKVDNYRLIGDGHGVKEKKGEHKFEVKTPVKHWGENGKFKVYVNISDFNHPEEWFPLNSDTYQISTAQE